MKLKGLYLILLIPLSSAVRILGDLLAKAEKDGFIDFFIHFEPFNFHSSTMSRVKKFINFKIPNIMAYAGVQEFPIPALQSKEQKQRGVRRQIIMELLQRHARETQAATMEELKGANLKFTSFWIDNSILIKDAPLHVVNLMVNLAADESHNIISLSPNRIVSKIPPISKMIHANDEFHQRDFYAQLRANGVDLDVPKVVGEKDLDGVPWNLEMINVDKLWKKTKGKGVVVANIDTGVDFLHPLLKDQYRGTNRELQSISHEYNWFDPSNTYPLPHDGHGHGTHTIGTIIGVGVGIAIEAKWIAAQGCSTEDCSQERLIASAQWVMCPTDAEGKNPRCDLGADIVNNSWGGEITDDESMTWFSKAVDAWIAAGIFPIFSQGNSGPGCGTVVTPGDLEDVIGVGAVDQIAKLSVFSSRGPGGSRLGHARLKPDLVAPGQSIVSCAKGGGIISMSGTSMAAPHVAGIAALLLSLKGDLTFEEFRKALIKTADTTSLKEPHEGQQACSGKTWSVFPNYHYGNGLVDAFAAAQMI